jgi:DNA processing protein
VDAINEQVTERLDRLRLIRLDHGGPRTFNSLLHHFGNARTALERLPDLARRGGAARAERICTEEEARAEILASKKLGVSLLAPGEAGYPPRLSGRRPIPTRVNGRASPACSAHARCRSTI